MSQTLSTLVWHQRDANGNMSDRTDTAGESERDNLFE